jgi:hypothetical protein
MNGDDTIVMSLDTNGTPVLPAVKYDGYVFIGWFIDVNGISVRYDGWALAEDTVMYAQWTADSGYVPPDDVVPAPDAGNAWDLRLMLLILFTASVYIICVFREGSK